MNTFIEFRAPFEYNYVIQIENTNHRDTILGIRFDPSGGLCNNGYKNYRYLLNGVRKTDLKLVIR